MPIKLIDRFGGLGDAIDEAKRRIGLAASDRVQLRELPDQPASLLGALGTLIGVSGERTPGPLELPALRALLLGVPASLLVDPGQAAGPAAVHRQLAVTSLSGDGAPVLQSHRATTFGGRRSQKWIPLLPRVPQNVLPRCAGRRGVWEAEPGSSAGAGLRGHCRIARCNLHGCREIPCRCHERRAR